MSNNAKPTALQSDIDKAASSFESFLTPEEEAPENIEVEAAEEVSEAVVNEEVEIETEAEADVEMEASPAQILDALFANEGQIVTHTGWNFLDIIIYVKLILNLLS